MNAASFPDQDDPRDKEPREENVAGDNESSSKPEDYFDQVIAQSGISGEELDGFSEEVDQDLQAWQHLEALPPEAGDVALVLTNLLEAVPLATMMAAHEIDARIVETESGCVVWKRLTPTPDDELEALLGEERPVCPEAEELALAVSKLPPMGQCCLFLLCVRIAMMTRGYRGRLPRACTMTDGLTVLFQPAR